MRAAQTAGRACVGDYQIEMTTSDADGSAVSLPYELRSEHHPAGPVDLRLDAEGHSTGITCDIESTATDDEAAKEIAPEAFGVSTVVAALGHPTEVRLGEVNAKSA